MDNPPRILQHEVRMCPVADLVPHPKNARKHAAAILDESIAENGIYKPVLASTASGFILAGHGVLERAMVAGLTEIPVYWIDGLAPADELKILAADNRTSDVSPGYDDQAIAELLQTVEKETGGLAGTGFDQAAFDEVLKQAGIAVDQCAPIDPAHEDDVPAPPAIPVSVPGDLWLLGKHRVLCGDATQIDAVENLMDGQKADLVFTDPPYNVDYEGYTQDKLKIQGDMMDAAAFDQFLHDAFVSYLALMNPAASIYVCHASSVQRQFENQLEGAGFEVRCQIIWAKNTFAWGFGRYKFQHEPIFYAHVAGQSDAWYGDKTQSTLWEEKKPAANRLHPTMKPVELIERALMNSSRRGEIVADLFGGSGSTMIACEKTGRQARLMELDPKYVDVIVKRWQDLTHKDATLADDGGRTFEELATERLATTAV